jgi:hypothetical protein
LSSRGASAGWPAEGILAVMPRAVTTAVGDPQFVRRTHFHAKLRCGPKILSLESR